MLEDEQKERRLIGKKGEKAIFSTMTSSLLPVRIPTAAPLRVLNLKRDFCCVPNYNRDSISTYIRLSSLQLARHTLPGSITGEAGRADPTLNRKSLWMWWREFTASSDACSRGREHKRESAFLSPPGGALTERILRRCPLRSDTSYGFFFLSSWGMGD